MGFEPTTLRDLVGCSNHRATGDSMVSKGHLWDKNSSLKEVSSILYRSWTVQDTPLHDPLIRRSIRGSQIGDYVLFYNWHLSGVRKNLQVTPTKQGLRTYQGFFSKFPTNFPQALRPILEIWGYWGISVNSFSWGIFSLVTRLHQSRTRVRDRDPDRVSPLMNTISCHVINFKQ